jgi:hypothetical protein
MRRRKGDSGVNDHWCDDGAPTVPALHPAVHSSSDEYFAFRAGDFLLPVCHEKGLVDRPVYTSNPITREALGRQDNIGILLILVTPGRKILAQNFDWVLDATT